jgi:hypothetical protein
MAERVLADPYFPPCRGNREAANPLEDLSILDWVAAFVDIREAAPPFDSPQPWS